jgi:hypothetical protein
MTMKDPRRAESLVPPSHHVGRLILAPRDSERCPDRDRLVRTLFDAGFIADPIPSCDWTHQGGFARLLVRVEKIFPGEAVPTEEGLLDLLERASGCAWGYF